MIWKFKHREILSDRTHLMGVINLTPDSFSDGGKYRTPEDAVLEAIGMVHQGAELLDLGAESTRPGARSVSAEEELKRLVPVLERLRHNVSVPIAVDTTKAEVARIALELGADVINDVSGLKDSGPEMARLAREFRAGLVVMHRRGNPQTMQTLTQYDDVVADVIEELGASVDIALREGVEREQIVIDPGLGFAKTADQNLEILKRIHEFEVLGFPLLLGPSRKSFIGYVTGREVGEREFGTAGVVAFCAMKRIPILRVHSVGAMRDVLCIIQAIKGDAYVGAFEVGKHQA